MERKWIVPQPEIVAMSAQAADKLIAEGSAEAALLYIYLLKKGEAALETAGRELRLRAPENAMQTLERLGLVGQESRRGPLRREDAPPQYTVEEIRGDLARGSDFGELVQEAQGLLGRVLSGGDLITLYGIYDYLGMPPEVILLLLRHCLEQCVRRYGEGRKPTFRAIEREAYRWAEADVMTLPAAEALLARTAREQERFGALRRLLGLSDRALSRSEENYLRAWAGMDFPDEAVALAYDKTTVNTGKLSWAYMDSILRRWHAKGLHTLSEIEQGDEKRPAARSPGQEEGDEREVERMREYLSRLRDGE